MVSSICPRCGMRRASLLERLAVTPCWPGASGQDWYVGAIGDSQGLTLHLPMSFLRSGVTYEATLYSDDPAVQTATHVAITQRRVTRDSLLDLQLLPRGGAAIYLRPVAGAAVP